MTPEKECERLRTENGLLRAALETVPALVEENARLRDSLAKGRAVLARVEREIMPTLETLDATRDEIRAILEASPRPFEAARGAKSRRSDSRAERALDLHKRGLSATRIGMRMAIEDGRLYPAGEDAAGRVRAYSERQVRRWLGAKKG